MRIWSIGLSMALAGCGARSSLEAGVVALGGAGGGGTTSTAGSTGFAGSGPVVGGTFGQGGTFGEGGTFGSGGTFGEAGAPVAGAPAMCALAVADCATSTDAGCEGQRKACTGDVLFQKELASDQLLWVTDLAVSREGQVAITGYFNGLANLGGHIISSPPNSASALPIAPFVVLFDPAGKPSWAYVYQSDGLYYGTGVAFAPNGDVIMQGMAPNGALPGAIVVRLSSDGHPIWTVDGGSAEHVTTAGVGVDNDGRIWVTGDFDSAFEFAGIKLTTTKQPHAYLIQLSPTDGAALVARDVTPVGWDSSEMPSVAVDDEDHVLVVGGLLNNSKRGGFFAKLSAQGDFVFNKVIEGSLQPRGVAVDRLMRPVLFGAYDGPFTNGGQAFDVKPPNYSNLWLAQYSREGELNWQKSYTADASPGHGSIDPFGNIIVSGSGSYVSIDGKTLKSQHIAEGGDASFAFMFKLRPDSSTVWTHTFDGDGKLAGVGTDNNGYIWTTAAFQHEMWVDGTKHPASNVTGLLLQIAP